MQRSLRLALLLSLLLASPALAQEEGGLLSVEPGLIIWTVIIFLIVLAVLYKAAYPRILGVVEAREAHIRELLAAAARDREEAQALLEQQRREMEGVRTRTQEMLAEGRAAGERMREELLAQTRREQEELMSRARRDIQGEMDRASAQLRTEVVELAIAAASRLVDRNLDQEDNRRLVREFLAEVGTPGGATVSAGV
jgi:F-type H+-transporting ATPase subunit b